MFGNRKIFITGALLGLVLSATIFFTGTHWGFALLIAIVNLGFSAWAASQSISMVSTTIEQNLPASSLDEFAIRWQGLLLDVLPVWQRNIETSRQQTEDAIGNLASRFSGINQQLNNAVRLYGGGGSNEIQNIIGNAETQLSSILNSLNQALAARETMLSEINGLALT